MSILKPFLWFLGEVLEALTLMFERYRRMYQQSKKFTLNTKILTHDLAELVNKQIGARLSSSKPLVELALATDKEWAKFWNTKLLHTDQLVQVGYLISMLFVFQEQSKIFTLGDLRQTNREDLAAVIPGIGIKGAEWLLVAFAKIEV